MTRQAWLITGVSSGSGRHLAEQILARGDRVVGTVRHVGCPRARNALGCLNELIPEEAD